MSSYLSLSIEFSEIWHSHNFRKHWRERPVQRSLEKMLPWTVLRDLVFKFDMPLERFGCPLDTRPSPWKSRAENSVANELQLK